MALVLAPVLVIFAACLWHALGWVNRPFPGFLIAENGIVVSIGRAEWAHARYRSLPFARVLAVDGRPVSGGRDVHAYVETHGSGKPIIFTFRQGTDIFRLPLRVRPFGRDDFLELFVPLLGVGLLMVLMSAAVVALRPRAAEACALFVVCSAIGLALITGADAYWPYWFTSMFYLSLCVVPPASLQLALTYPQRRGFARSGSLLWVPVYLPFIALAFALIVTMREPSLFLPLLYTAYFFIANGVLLNVGALLSGLLEGLEPRRPVLLALAGVLGSSLLVVVIFVSYPLLQRPIAPAAVFGPLLLLPLLEGFAFVRFPRPRMPAR